MQEETKPSPIYLIDVERRDWSKRLRSSPPNLGGTNGPAPAREITRRYLMIVEDPALRSIIQKEFSHEPHLILPHESGKEHLFYCIAGPSYRRPKRLIESIRYKLKKNNLDESALANLEVLTA